MGTKIEWCDESINPLGWGCYGPGGTSETRWPMSEIKKYYGTFKDYILRVHPRCRTAREAVQSTFPQIKNFTPGTET